ARHDRGVPQARCGDGRGHREPGGPEATTPGLAGPRSGLGSGPGASCRAREAEEVPGPAVPRGQPEDPPGALRGLQALPGGLPRRRGAIASRRARRRLSGWKLSSGRALGGWVEGWALSGHFWLRISKLTLLAMRERGEVYPLDAAEEGGDDPAVTLGTTFACFASSMG